MRFLRRPQLRALETYWYLRRVQGTPHIPALYERLFPDAGDRVEALGVSLSRPEVARALATAGASGLIGRIRTDDDFVRSLGLQADMLGEEGLVVGTV